MVVVTVLLLLHVSIDCYRITTSVGFPFVLKGDIGFKSPILIYAFFAFRIVKVNAFFCPACSFYLINSIIVFKFIILDFGDPVRNLYIICVFC